MMESEERITLIDRFAVGLLSALSAFITLGILIMMAFYVTQGDHIFVTLKIFSGVVVFFFILGFATLDNYFISILNPIWKLIGKLIRWN